MTIETTKRNKVFLSKLSLPVHTIMTPNAVGCATQIAQTLSFNATNQEQLESAVKEAFRNTVEQYANTNLDSKNVDLEFTIEDDVLVISIRDEGIPFDTSQTDKYTPENLMQINLPALSHLLMTNSIHSVEFFTHGRKGRETRITKKISFGAIPYELWNPHPTQKKAMRPTIKNAVIRPPKEEELAQICRLAWRCYGYTQEDLLYDLDLLTERTRQGTLKLLAGFDPTSKNMIFNVALKYHSPKSKVPEIGLAFADPAYRIPGLSRQAALAIYDMSQKAGDDGVFDCSVTTHTQSQRALQDCGSQPCSILLGIAAEGMQAKELNTSKQQKGSIVNHYIAFNHSPRTVYCGAQHQDIAKDIYSWLNVPRTFGTPNMEPPTGPSSVEVFNLPDELNVSFIIINTIGQETALEFAQKFRDTRYERRDAVFAFLPLGVASSPYLVEQCEKLGFSFAGIMPHVHDGDDRITLQWVDHPVDFEAIRVYGDKSRQLFTYVQNEIARIEGL